MTQSFATTEQTLASLMTQANNHLAGIPTVPGHITGLRLRAKGTIIEVAIEFHDGEVGIAVTAAAFASPYVFAEAVARSFHLYRFPEVAAEIIGDPNAATPYRGASEVDETLEDGILAIVGHFPSDGLLEPDPATPTTPIN